MAMEAQYYRQRGDSVAWDVFPKGIYWDKVVREPEGLPFLTLPRPDRYFTRAQEYTSGNYKYLPGTHIMAASGCWHGKCTFCVEKGKKYEVREVIDVIKEISECKEMGFKEVFDDSGTFPDGEWMRKFCTAKVFAGLKDFPIGCNMRIGADVDFKMMKDAGFRMILVGIESANQKTLDRIQKGVKANEIIPTIKQAKEAGIDVHCAVMYGCPCEEDKDYRNTERLVYYLLTRGYAKTAQSSIYDVKDFQLTGKEKKIAKRYVKKIYACATSPLFWYNKIKDIKNCDDLKYLWRQIKAGMKGVLTWKK